jgi:hypothetical protein
MKKVVRLTESDLTRIVKRVIRENNNQKYYSQRNLRRLAKTPIVMVESIEQYRPLVLNEGVFDYFKDKISSAVDNMTGFFKEKAEKIKDSVEDYFDKSIEDVTLDDVKLALKDDIGESEELSEKEDKDSFSYKFKHADIGNDAMGVPIKDKGRIGQKVLNFFTTIFGVNVLSFGLIGTIIMKFFGMMIPMPISLVVSAVAVGILIIIRKVIAVLAGKVKVKESFYRKYKRY